jgi:hypothetical protein
MRFSNMATRICHLGNSPFKWRSRDGKIAMKGIVDALQ